MPACSLSWRSSNLGVVVVVLRPVQIHPQEHFGPIVGVGAAVAGVDRQQRGVGVERPAQQGLRLHHLERLLEPVQFGGHFGRQIVVFLGHLDQRGQIVGRLEHLLQAASARP